MTDENRLKFGQVLWHDLTVTDANEIRDFYSQVIGWEASRLNMGTYDDYNMISPDNREAVTGIFHTRGSNANLPSLWLTYVAVED